MPHGYPVTLIVEGRPCLVVGGGPVAARKAAGLLECGARVRVVAERVGPEIRSLAVDWEERPYRAGEAGRYWLVATATDHPEVTREVAADAEAAGVLVNAADDPGLCSFFLPAVARRGRVSVAVSTEGASPALARWLRDRVADEYVGPEYGVLADLLAERRDEIHAAGRSTESVDWRAALDSDMLDLVRTGRVDQARERMQRCLS
ncbi:MAG TPA: bifunctional precorrin-2 dehydrogenase/sirohydrochlorin ferrochelatase [Acidimicrobiales bacterium]|nr:bifunctional precorrin-2 dehydrogenase/sirohydrochlorin ferrochelatase [Acidimicrobiales bacterium]